MTLKQGDKVRIGLNGYDANDPAPPSDSFEGELAIVVNTYVDTSGVFACDLRLLDRDKHRRLSGAEDNSTWPFYPHELELINEPA